MSADKLLDPAELLAAARRETGLNAFDTPPIDEPLERLTRALRELRRAIEGEGGIE